MTMKMELYLFEHRKRFGRNDGAVPCFKCVRAGVSNFENPSVLTEMMQKCNSLGEPWNILESSRNARYESKTMAVRWEISRVLRIIPTNLKVELSDFMVMAFVVVAL